MNKIPRYKFDRFYAALKQMTLRHYASRSESCGSYGTARTYHYSFYVGDNLIMLEKASSGKQQAYEAMTYGIKNLENFLNSLKEESDKEFVLFNIDIFEDLFNSAYNLE